MLRWFPELALVSVRKHHHDSNGGTEKKKKTDQFNQNTHPFGVPLTRVVAKLKLKKKT